MSGSGSYWYNLLFVGHWGLFSLGLWLIFQIEVFILNLFRVRNLSIIGNSSWIAAVLSIWLDCVSDTASRPLLWGILLAICRVSLWLFLLNSWSWITCCCRSSSILVLATQIILLFKLRYDSFFNIAKMCMLQPGQLYKLLGPYRLDIAVLPTRWRNWTSNQIVISIDKLVVLNTKQREEVNVLFEQLHCFDVWF